MYASNKKRAFTIKIRFPNLEKYEAFRTWYKNECRYGLNSFIFPKIDSAKGEDTVYQFADGGSPKYSNVGGQVIDATVTWEEV